METQNEKPKHEIIVEPEVQKHVNRELLGDYEKCLRDHAGQCGVCSNPGGIFTACA